jgi:hypothetical protein
MIEFSTDGYALGLCRGMRVRVVEQKLEALVAEVTGEGEAE